MPSPLRNMINGVRRGRPLACLSNITAWVSGGRGGGRTSFPLPGLFIAISKLNSSITLSELSAKATVQSSCNVRRMTHIIAMDNTVYQSQVYTVKADTFNSRLSLYPLYRIFLVLHFHSSVGQPRWPRNIDGQRLSV